MNKKVIFRLLVVFLIVQGALAMRIDYKLHIGKNPKTGRFGIWSTEHPMTIQEKILEEFQPDEYYKENELPLQIYGSEKLYQIFANIFGNQAIGSFKLLRMLLIINIILLVVAFMINRVARFLPTKGQIVFEMVYSFFEDLTGETLGKDRLHFTAYALTLFLFIFMCNCIAIIPVPGFIEPTRDLNVPLGLGVVVLAVVHYMSIKHKGIKEYLKGYTEPFLPFAPINVVGELAKGVSISFRLFGNVLGGSIIMLVVSSLVRYVVLPVGLNLFFGLFVGTIQAFVFTMLALSYIAVEISD